jgi:uncharacterized membrane protein
MKMNGKLLWLFLSAVGLAMLLLPYPLLAQETVRLTLTLLPGDYYHEVIAGKDNSFFLEIRNTGNKALTNIRLSVNVPDGWAIQFAPDKISSLSAGSLQTVDVNIKPDGKASRREYGFTIIAEANETRKVESIWVTVKSSSFWLWVGGGVAIVVVAVFVLIYLRLERQKG